jgi:cohesin complex subunit SCC1
VDQTASDEMFYSEQVLAKKKGALARIWIAAHFERKLSKAQLIQTNIESSVGAFFM